MLDGVQDASVVIQLCDGARRLARAPGNVTVNCEALERLDAAAVQVLVALKRRIEASGHSLRLGNVPRSVLCVLKAAGIANAVLDCAPAAEPSA